ncbi:alpha/beta hydrolase [Acrocarpospora catenulata]|uniref:alpha/beta hydrolase n=1 Tax=Acrocarpospora catenulata TaxID=2836182 RepID=UPI001BDA7E0F|nr:alpha/beta hydrolase [Acrocarpospora catenulata]
MTLLTVTLSVLGSLGLAAPAHATEAAVERRDCPALVPAGTTCGFLIVPERRDVFGTSTIKVAFAVHKGDGTRADPVVYSSGGPGSASLPLIGALADLAPGRDVVVIEQRGGRYSEPRLHCPEIATGIVAGLTRPGDEGITAAADVCRARLTADLKGYRTREIAADVGDLRRALGYPQWNLFGVSYSSRSMLLAATLDPAGTRTVVLDSYLPEQAAWYDQAAPALRGAVDKLGIGDRFRAMTERLNRRPAVLETHDPVTGRRVTVTLDGNDVITLLGEAMRETALLPVVPVVVDGIADGDYSLIQPLLDEAGAALVSHELGQYYAVQCQDEAPRNTFADRSLLTVATDATVCDRWQLSAAGPDNSATEAPVLVLGGQYDPTTPPESAAEAAGTLPNARFTEFAGVSHGVFLGSDCGRRTVTAFLDDPQAPAPCDPGRAPYPIMAPGALHPTTAGYTLQAAPWLLAPLGLFLLASVLQLAGGVLTVRRGGWVTALAGLTGLAFGGLAALSLSGMSGNPLPLAFGLPPALVWYGLLAVASAALSVVAAFRLRAPAVSIVPAGLGIIFVTWLYAWVL